MTPISKWCGLKPHNPLPEGSTARRRASWLALVLAIVVTLAGYGLSFAQTESADLRQEVFQLLTAGDNVRDSESWARWMEQWQIVVRHHGGDDTATLAFGQIVGVPASPADVRYTDWSQVPYPARPSLALAHACGLMTGRLAADGTLEWAAREPLKRFEAANIAARSVELMFEILLTGAVYSRPGCPLSLGAFYGDPEVIDDLLRRQESRHEAAIAELRAALDELATLESLPAEMRKRLEAELERRIEFQREIKSSLAELERRLFAELDARDARLRADWSEFDSMLNELRAGHKAQDARLDSLEARVTALESRAAPPAVPAVHAPVAAPRADYAPVWINWTGPDGKEFGPSSPYRGGEVSANLGLNAGPESVGWVIVSVTVPPDGVRANDSQEHWKRSFWYSHLDPSRIHKASITVRGPSGQILTVSHTLGH